MNNLFERFIFMKKLALPLAAALLLTISSAVRAQGPPGGGAGPSPEMMAMFKKFGEWREKNKNLASMGQTIGMFAEFEKDPKTALTKDQAKKILAAVAPWKTKPIMTDANAKELIKTIGKTMTVAQATKSAQLAKEAAARRGQFGGGGGGRMGGGGGAPGGGGGRPGGGGGMGAMDPAAMKKRFDTMMKGYNPLNFATVPDSPMKERSIKPVKEGLAALEKKAK
jgi:uncharacterized membrane protein YgcG